MEGLVARSSPTNPFRHFPILTLIFREFFGHPRDLPDVFRAWGIQVPLLDVSENAHVIYSRLL